MKYFFAGFNNFFIDYLKLFLEELSMNARELPSSFFSRLSLAIFFQKQNTKICPEETIFKNKIALVTGSTGGIGKEIALGLLVRGIRTILTGRSIQKIDKTRKEFIARGIDKKLIYSLCFDLSDLDTLREIKNNLIWQIGTEKISILIENAGIWPRTYATTKNNFEIAYGTNVLGHQVLRNILIDNFLVRDARIVITTGDIYFIESKAQENLQYKGMFGGMKAYCQSKLGNIWIAANLQRSYPDYTVAIVHPGVIASGLGGTGTIGRHIKSLFMINTTVGAQTTLIAATQPNIIKCGYYHNSVGLAEFPKNDPALDETSAITFWELTEKIASRFR
jgi:NAD(P)-dependent dehydrogenase (short-subunit alcohol dehydrogenase family)